MLQWGEGVRWRQAGNVEIGFPVVVLLAKKPLIVDTHGPGNSDKQRSSICFRDEVRVVMPGKETYGHSDFRDAHLFSPGARRFFLLSTSHCVTLRGSA
ncbi:MAG TPA: hypothetical protein VFQ36_05325 [Ktedonobacteraceae bacterium]|nr:hypothetical protein [Ktedonobacteraceae bacterium]